MANIKVSATEILEMESGITPYQVHTVLNSKLAELEIDRQVPPQMMYNYDRNGVIVKGRASKVTKEAGRYSNTEVINFVTKWIEKNYKIQTSFESIIDPFEDVSDENLVDGPIPTMS